MTSELSAARLAELEAFALDLARAAGAAILPLFRADHGLEDKGGPGAFDPVTAADKGAEAAINRPHAFELSSADEAMFFIADSDKEKEDWINAVGRAIVRHSRSLLEGDQADYTPASVGGGGGGGA